MEEYFGPGGWVKVHRKIIGWRWASSSNHMALFMQILLRANFKETNWRNEHIKPGQLLTGSKQLSEWTGLSRMQVRRALKDLEDSGEITSKTTNKYSVITITNWDSYQIRDQQATNKEPTNDQQVTTSKKDNNTKKEKNIIIKPSPLSFLFDARPDIQEWLNKGSHDTHLILLKREQSHHEIAELITKAFEWASAKDQRSENWLLTFFNNKTPNGYGLNQAQNPKTRITEGNPMGNPYLDDNGNVRKEA